MGFDPGPCVLEGRTATRYVMSCVTGASPSGSMRKWRCMWASLEAGLLDPHTSQMCLYGAFDRSSDFFPNVGRLGIVGP